MWPHQHLGSPGKPTLLFLHGFLGRGSDWLPVASGLADDFHCLLPDLPGHGEHKNLNPAAPLSFKQIAGELAFFLDSAGGRQTTLVGYSLGGRLALHFAAAHPDRVRALVLESASPGLRDPDERARRAALDDDRAGAIRKDGMPKFLAGWYRTGLWASLQARPELLDTLISGRSGNDPAWIARVIADLSPGRMPPLWDRLPELACPTLLVHGVLDEKYTGITARMHELAPESALATIPEAGHNTHLEQPEHFLQTLQGFLYNLK